MYESNVVDLKEFTTMSPGTRARILDELIGTHNRLSPGGPMQVGKSLDPRRRHEELTGGCDVARDERTGEAEGPRPYAITLENVERVFTYQSWDSQQIRQADPVREAILALARSILRHVPDCPDRSVALRKLRELRMDVNSAITHRGQF